MTTIVNSGSIGTTATLGAGDYLYNTGSGAITGYPAVYGIGGPITVANEGTISSGSRGIELIGGGSMINRAGGLIAGAPDAVLFREGSGTLVNAGNIAGYVYLANGGAVTNQIGGSLQGIVIRSGLGTIDNSGSIVNSGGDGIVLTSDGTVGNAGAIIGGRDGIYAFGGAINNETGGTIVGNVGYGIELTAGGSVTNQAGGLIEGSAAAVQIDRGGTVVNAGNIDSLGNGYAVLLTNGGVVTNRAGGSIDGFISLAGFGRVDNGGDITGLGRSIRLGAGGTLANSGTIRGAVYLFGGGAVTNETGASIAGGEGDGVVLDDGTVTNQTGGSIAGRYGVALSHGTVINQSGGSIVGSSTGIVIRNGGTVENGGTISGATAIYLGGAGAKRLVLDPGYRIDGNVVTTGAATLELAAGTGGSGTLTGLGSKFSNFATIVEDAGATWTVNNTDAFGGIALTVFGTLVNQTALATTVTLTAGGTLDNLAGGIIQTGGVGVFGQNGPAAVKNSGTIGGAGVGVEFLAGGSVANYGVIDGGDAGINLLNGGSVTNGSAGSITGGNFGIYAFGGVGTVVNAGTIVGGGNGLRLNFGGSLDNAANGVITGQYAVYISGYRSGVAGTVTNAGTISNSTIAVYLYGGAGGRITNSAGGLLSGLLGIRATSQAPTIINQGTVSGTQRGIEAEGIASVTNQARGLIEGGSGGGVYVYGPGSAVTNAGTIDGGSDGVRLVYGGQVSNSGTIVGTGQAGIYCGYGGSAYAGPTIISNTATIAGNIGVSVDATNIAANTLVNAGAIIGTGGTAVAFGSGNDLVVVDPGALFVGVVDGGGGQNTLELATGSGAGMLADLGSQFVDFTSIAVDAGAAWTLTGSSTIAGGLSLANSGTLVFTGTLDIAGTVLGAQGTALGFGAGSNLLVLETSGVLNGAIDGYLLGDTIDLRGVVTAGMTTLGAGNLLKIPESGGSATLQLDPNQNYSQDVFRATSDGFGGSDITITLDPGPTAGAGSTTVGHSKTVDLTSLVDGLVTPGLPGDSETPTAAVATYGAASIVNGVLSYTAPASGPDTLTYTVADQFGDAASGAVTITVDPGPTAGTGATTVGHGKTVDLTGLVNGLVAPGLSGDTETLISVSAAHGNATLVSGVISYTAPTTGPDALTYTVADQYGDTASGALNIAVDPGPTAGTGATTVGHGKTVDLTRLVDGLVTPGLAGDSETITAVSSAHGTVSVANGIVTYTAPAAGTDTLSYMVADQYSDSASGALNVTVDPGPIAVAGSVGVAVGASTDLTSYLLGLSTPGLSGDMLTLTGDNTTGTTGAVSLVNGDLTYTAPTTASSDSFGYTVSDQYGDSASATLSVSSVSLSHIGNGNGTIVLGDSSGTTSFGQGSVTVFAGDGNNSISGGNAGDTITAGNGNDTISLGNGANTVSLGSGNDSVTVGDANNAITIAGAPSSVDTITAGNGNNTLNLGAGTYTVVLGNGNNTINMNGGTYGVTAGHGTDLFVFDTPQALLDLKFASNDELVFKNPGFDLGADDGTGTSTPQTIASSLFGAFPSIGTSADRFAYNQSTGDLYCSANGSLASEAHVAHLTNAPHLTAASLFFIS